MGYSRYADEITGLLARSAGVPDEHGNLHSPDDGKFVSKDGRLAAAVKEAVKAFAGTQDDQGRTSGAYFEDREGAEANRFWEIDHDGNETFTVRMVHDDSEHVDVDEDGEETPAGIELELDNQEMVQLGDEIALTLLKRDPPPFDPADRRSVLIASMLAQSRGGIDLSDGRNFDFSTEDFEATNAAGDTERFALSNQELNQLHSTVMSALFKQKEAALRG